MGFAHTGSCRGAHTLIWKKSSISRVRQSVCRGRAAQELSLSWSTGADGVSGGKGGEELHQMRWKGWNRAQAERNWVPCREVYSIGNKGYQSIWGNRIIQPELTSEGPLCQYRQMWRKQIARWCTLSPEAHQCVFLLPSVLLCCSCPVFFFFARVFINLCYFFSSHWLSSAVFFF